MHVIVIIQIFGLMMFDGNNISIQQITFLWV